MWVLKIKYSSPRQSPNYLHDLPGRLIFGWGRTSKRHHSNHLALEQVSDTWVQMYHNLGSGGWVYSSIHTLSLWSICYASESQHSDLWNDGDSSHNENNANKTNTREMLYVCLTLHLLILTSQHSYETNAIIIPVLQMRYTEVKFKDIWLSCQIS